jgi:ribosomal protein L25 (general stress protein Ctc)
MKTNAQERKAIAHKHIRALKVQVKVADDHFQKSKECKAILKKKKEIENLSDKIKEINTSIDIDIENLNEAKGWGRSCEGVSRTGYFNGTYCDHLRIDLGTSTPLREEIEQEICIAQIDSDDLESLFKKL